MQSPSPLEDPDHAAHAWARYRRILRWVLALSLAVVAVAFVLIYLTGEPVSVHFYVAVGLGVGLTLMLTGALMGLVFLSSGTGHDEAADAESRSGRKRQGPGGWGPEDR